MKYQSLVYINLIKTTDLLGKVNTLLGSMHNPYLLTYILESVDALKSNEVEAIHTTYDEAETEYIENNSMSPFVRYRETLKQAHVRLLNNEIIRSSDIEWINNNLMASKIGYRKTPVTIKDNNGKVIHQPIDAQKIPDKMIELIDEINSDRGDELRVLQALRIHHSFEEIHPFYDGNGRTGRILLALLLTKYELLDIPASVLSFAIANGKKKYYDSLKAADNNDMDTYYIGMLELFNLSLKTSIDFIKKYNKQVIEVKKNTKLPEKYHGLIDFVFSAVKTTNKYLSNKLDLNNKTVTKYIDLLANEGIIEQKRNGVNKQYINIVLKQTIEKYYLVK